MCAILHFNTPMLKYITLFGGNTAEAEKQEEKVHLQKKRVFARDFSVPLPYMGHERKGFWECEINLR